MKKSPGWKMGGKKENALNNFSAKLPLPFL